MKKIIFLSTLCLSLATGATFAQSFGGGRGTESDPVLISSRAHMEELAMMISSGSTYEGYHFKLTADLTGITTIIGKNEYYPFRGVFDGDGHTIELNINTTERHAGVFGYLSGATVKNTKVSGRIITDNYYAGGICGSADNSTISNCYNTGSISSLTPGGICGYANRTTISNCYNTGNISSTSNSNSSWAGGICGAGGAISNCYNTGSISAPSAGGICGRNGTISNCYNTGKISSSGSSNVYIGGICGWGQSSTISNCYNTGSISSSASSYSYVGGICGYSSTISNCYNMGNISSDASGMYSYAGSICGDARIISNCFAANATITTIHSSQAGRIDGRGYGRITNCHALISMKLNGLERRSMNADSKDGADSEEADFKNRSWLTSSLKWDFGTVWTIGRSGWPVLKGMDEPAGILSPEMPLPEVVLYPNPATHDVYVRSDRPVSKVE
ncbi:MAG: hypothetical protein LBK07_03490, partial [Tannerella sp.]|nr:hypothetical protein [Tannerella sp.]